MKYDKKASGGRMRLVLPTAMGRVEVVEDAPIDAVHHAWASVGAAVVASGGSSAGIGPTRRSTLPNGLNFTGWT